jgi:hypothetical protein
MSNPSLVAALPRGRSRRGDLARFTRIVLEPGEICRIETGFGEVRVLSGTAWITCRGKDHVLPAGSLVRLPRSARHCSLLSGLRGEPVVVELRA